MYVGIDPNTLHVNLSKNLQPSLRNSRDMGNRPDDSRSAIKTNEFEIKLCNFEMSTYQNATMDVPDSFIRYILRKAKYQAEDLKRTSSKPSQSDVEREAITIYVCNQYSDL